MDKKEFQELLDEECNLYLGEQYESMRRKLHKRYCIWKYIRYYRYFKYYECIRKDLNLPKTYRFWAKIMMNYMERSKNLWGIRTGIEIGATSNIGKRCNIWHSNVIINGTIGNDCVFHGNNIIGNKGIGKEEQIPVLGNRVDVGAGAIIIGNIHIPDDCIIGAGAVVIESFEESGSIIAGCPAKIVLKKTKKF